jgi:hypothetical protein
MSYKLAELQGMPMEQLIREHDEQAKTTIMGVNYYLDEIRRRQAKEQGDRIERLTVWLAGLTVAITVLTLVSTVAVVLSVVRACG